MTPGRDDPVYGLMLAFGVVYAAAVGLAAGRPGLGAGLVLVNLTAAGFAMAVMPGLREGRGIVRFLGVTLPLFVWYLYFKETGFALAAPHLRWADRRVAGLELPLWESAGHAPGSPFLGEAMAAAYMAYVPLLVLVAASLVARPERGAGAPAETFVRRVAVAWGLCYLLYLAVPVQGPRLAWPELQPPRLGHGPASLLARLNQERGMLQGAAFPSAHVAATAVATYSVWQWRRPLFALVLPVGLALCAGAVYLGYHYVVDIAAGLAVAGLAVVLEKRLMQGWMRARDRRRPASPVATRPDRPPSPDRPPP
jgi:membrane-associated phospholipid phosphatase